MNFNTKIHPTKFLRFGILFSFLFVTYFSFSQEKKRVDILNAAFLTAAENIANNAQRLVGSVKLKHDDILIWCDSAYTYTGTNRVDAFGNVHINQNDTLHLFANKIYYNGDRSFARAITNVRLENKNTTLYTDTLDYDLAANIGYYDDNGKIEDSTNVLTSKIGKYFIDQDLIHFIHEVEGSNENYTLSSDTLLYNTVTGMLYIEGPTIIQDSSNTLYAEDGWYNTNNGEAELTKEPEIYNDVQFLKAKYIEYNEAEGNGLAKGAVKIKDFENSTIVEGEYAVYSENIETAIVTDSAVFTMYSETDTLFLHADTLRTVPDTIDGEKLITAYYGVRFFRTDLQGLCDSLVYYTKDSVVQLLGKPIIWSEIHQLTAENISLKQNLDAPDEMHLSDNSFIISQQDSGQFDQIKGKNMIGYIVNNELDYIDVDGNGQTLYYAREEEEIIGLNRLESSDISIRFKEGKINKIIFRTEPQGILKPIVELTEEEKKLDGFEWKIKLRPFSKYDIFLKQEEPVEKTDSEKNELLPEK